MGGLEGFKEVQPKVIMEISTDKCVIARVRTPDGSLFLTVTENSEGVPIMVQINIGKAGTSVMAWSQALAATITMGLQNGIPIHKFIEQLSGITSDREARVLGQTCRSGPEGVYMALLHYTKSRFNELQDQLGFSSDDELEEEDDGRASVGNRARIRST